VAVNIDCCRRIVIRRAIGHRGVVVERRSNRAGVNLRPRRSVWTTIDVVADDIPRRRCLPSQVYHMVGRSLDDDFVRHLRDMPATPGSPLGEGVGTCSGRHSGKVQRRRVTRHLRDHASGECSGCDRPLVRSAAALRLDDRRIGRFDRAVLARLRQLLIGHYVCNL
jgi:hypothetical protein